MFCTQLTMPPCTQRHPPKGSFTSTAATAAVAAVVRAFHAEAPCPGWSAWTHGPSCESETYQCTQPNGKETLQPNCEGRWRPINSRLRLGRRSRKFDPTLRRRRTSATFLGGQRPCPWRFGQALNEASRKKTKKPVPACKEPASCFPHTSNYPTTFDHVNS